MLQQSFIFILIYDIISDIPINNIQSAFPHCVAGKMQIGYYGHAFVIDSFIDTPSISNISSSKGLSTGATDKESART